MFMCSSTTQRSNDCKTRPKTNILQTCGKNLRCYRELICLVDWLNDVSASEMLAVGSSTKEMLSDTMVVKCHARWCLLYGQYPVKITHMPPDQTDCDGSFAKNQTCRHQSRLNDYPVHFSRQNTRDEPRQVSSFVSNINSWPITNAHHNVENVPGFVLCDDDFFLRFWLWFHLPYLLIQLTCTTRSYYDVKKLLMWIRDQLVSKILIKLILIKPYSYHIFYFCLFVDQILQSFFAYFLFLSLPLNRFHIQISQKLSFYLSGPKKCEKWSTFGRQVDTWWTGITRARNAWGYNEYLSNVNMCELGSLDYNHHINDWLQYYTMVDSNR